MKVYTSLKTSGLLLLAAITAQQCNTEEPPAPEPLATEEVTDIPADLTRNGDFTYYSLTNGVVANGSETTKDWDLAFAGTTILINGGSSGPGDGAAQVVTGTLESIAEAPETGFSKDAEGVPAIQGSDSKDKPGWYNYTGEAPAGPKHAILIVPGRVLLIKTANGQYAKIEILSYYKGNPDTSTDEFTNLATRPPSRYYTFRFVLQPDGTRKF